MNYEIEFLPVGNGEKSGDAICIRWQEKNKYKVMVVDGGTKESGEQIVEHVKRYYNTEVVDYVVNTHPDQDHASGLSVVLEKLKVRELWIHRPWNYTQEIIDYFKDKRITKESLKRRLQDSFSYVYPLEELAIEKNIIIKEPYQGDKIGIFEVLSPSKEWYLYELIPDFNKTPDKKESILQEGFEKFAEKVLNWIEETFDKETLKIDGTTSADNESSVILYANINNRGILLTGDAGIKALNKAYKYKPTISNNLKFIQIPHHGSRNNVNPDILDKLLGKKGQKIQNKIAFVSVSKNSKTHPRQSVVNAFIRRGCKVIATKGSTKQHYKSMPERKGWTRAKPLQFKECFEE
ncbi:ComEC/Rec2 family competence protein [Nitratiruptor tergarcus]|uniref:Metal-dependent hydrolase, beta-lactamase superfamily II n=1 Tax=Nitratiruptor tergarcus DSM 16512 TaxID=1069081 RepID=A0A1W1WTH7_9BACT|nr:MBL fold metallo-hydrolase [Nitratiruptor tergarcus]SMC09499.1 Metal-dependent hydrolase, beta-lactamase superfamily II [Nitratiruptor tergarcus DSM 16512]